MGEALKWTADFIEGASTIRRKIYRSDGSLFTDKASNYDPPVNGVHLCGQTDDGMQPTTAAVYPMARADARRLFQIAKAVAAVEDGADDFVVDLCIDDEIAEDFLTNRQLWPRAIEAWNEAEVAHD